MDYVNYINMCNHVAFANMLPQTIPVQILLGKKTKHETK